MSNTSINESSLLIRKEAKCPTCKGSGRIRRDQEDALVALIPVSDSRLKPKRIWLWVLITFVVCIIVSSVLIALLAPREISIKNDLTLLKPKNVSLLKGPSNDTIGLQINFTTQYDIYNENYFDIKLRNILFDINRNGDVTRPSISYEKNFTIEARKNISFSIHVSYAMYTDDDPYAQLCITHTINNLFSLITSTFTFSTLWSSNQQFRIDSMQYIVCVKN
jgi:LEA14-like dessication related protein